MALTRMIRRKKIDRSPCLLVDNWKNEIFRMGIRKMTEVKIRPTADAVSGSGEIGMINIPIDEFNNLPSTNAVPFYTYDSSKVIRFPIKKEGKTEFGIKRIVYFEERKFLRSALEILE